MVQMGNFIAQRIHEVVLNGELGFDYSFDRNRDKNIQFKRKYNIDDDKIKR